MYWAALGCAGLYWAVFGCIGPSRAVLGCTGLNWDKLGCTGLQWAVVGWTWLYWAVLGCIGLCWAVLGCTGLYLAVLGWTGLALFIYWGSPLFFAVFGHSHVKGVPTLNFGPISTKIRGTVQAIKKMTQKDNRKKSVFAFGRQVFFGLKKGFTPKNHPKWHFPPWLFGQRHFFSLNNFFRSWPEHG